MVSRSGPSVIQFSVLDSVSHPLLQRLAEQLDLTPLVDGSNQVAPALYEVATRDDCDASLRETLDGIAALASDHGSEVLLAAGLDRDVDLAGSSGTTSGVDLAVLTYLEHPEVFRDARAQVRAVNHRMFAVYVCSRAVHLTSAVLKERLPWLEKRVSSWLREHGRPSACRAIVTETGTQLVVDIVVQGTPSLCMTVAGGEVLASRKRQDTLVFDRSGGCVSIHARHQREVEFYRALAGELVCGDPQGVRAKHVFQLRRLLRPQEWECGRHPVPGLLRVVLRGIEVESGSRRTRWRGAADLATGRGVEGMLERAERCTRVEFELHSAHRAYPCAVEVLPPNRICLDQRAIGSLATSYLKARGMFVAA